jgi:hypothetical protein
MIKEHRILTDALDVTVGWPSDGSGKREIEHDVENRCVQDIHPSYLFMKIPTTPLPIFPVCRIILSFVKKKGIVGKPKSKMICIINSQTSSLYSVAFNILILSILL